MTTVEIIAIVLVCLIPIVALVIILPKKIKNRKVKSTKTETQPLEQEPVKIEAEPNKNSTSPLEFTADDFKGYLTKKRKQVSHPKRLEENFAENLNIEDFNSYQARFAPRRNDKSQDKTIKEQFDELSPELKAMIIAGVFDKKDY